AAQFGHKDLVELLLNNKAAINATSTEGSETPLYRAVVNGHEEVAELLRQHGGFDSGSILDASWDGDSKTVKAFLKQNPNLAFSKDKNGDTPLHRAAYKGH